MQEDYGMWAHALSGKKREHCRVRGDFGSEADFRGAFAKVFGSEPASPRRAMR